MANDEHLRRAFAFFDKDGNGYIEPEELREALDDGSEDSTAVVNDILHEVDTDKVLNTVLSSVLADSLGLVIFDISIFSYLGWKDKLC